MRKKKSESRLSLHYDKLYVDNTVYVYNEESEEVEMIDHTSDEEEDHQVGFMLCNPFKYFNIFQ